MTRTILGMLAGVAAAILVIMGIEALGHALYPPPPGLDPRDPADVAAVIAAAPTAALLFVLAAWLVGTFAGAAIGARIARHPRAAAFLVALVVMTGVGAMIVKVPQHPQWLSALGFMLPLPLAWIAARLFGARPAPLPE
jgi:Na+-driven multidrug efflux pump